MPEAFIPKTSVKLKRGDYAFLLRDDGRFVPMVFLEHVPKRRVTFYGALLDLVLDEPFIDAKGPRLNLCELAMIDIEAFGAANAPVVGNLLERLDEIHIRAQLKKQRTQGLVWGKLTPLRYANALATTVIVN